MDLGSVIGFVFGIFIVIISIIIACAGDLAKAGFFLDIPSIVVVFGGLLAVMFIGFPLNTTLSALKSISKIFKPPNLDPASAITKIIDLANQARKEGILALEESASNMDDKFLQKGIMLIVDGTDPELVRSILETELAYIEGRHSQVKGVWEYIASMGPAWGMLGTLLGLIIMLADLNDPSSLGPSMAVAIVTTFYGSMIANFLATPVATKMKFFSDAEMLMKEVLIEGMLSIQAGENPRIIEEKLKAFLAPAIREKVGKEDKPAGKAEEGDDE